MWSDERVAEQAVAAARQVRERLWREAAERGGDGPDRSSREHLAKSLELATIEEFLASADLTTATNELLEVLRTPRNYTAGDVERYRVHREVQLWKFESAHTRVATIRDQIASLDAAEQTKANVNLAREAARAARTTARATVWLAVATFVLIVATLVAAWIASSGGG